MSNTQQKLAQIEEVLQTLRAVKGEQHAAVVSAITKLATVETLCCAHIVDQEAHTAMHLVMRDIGKGCVQMLPPEEREDALASAKNLAKICYGG